MPNYARQSALDLDEMYGSYAKNESNIATMRNIRTKEKMNSAVSDRNWRSSHEEITELQTQHHCEDKECGGSPSMRCVSALHFCWCLAPIVDKDKKSDTYGQVVVCGQRFQCISPKGCARHPYLEGFNIDIRDARNGYPATEVRWRLIFELFKTEHDAALANNAEQQELSRDWEGMTDHQKRRQRKLQDQAVFQRRCEQERAAGRWEINQLPLIDEEMFLARDEDIVGAAVGSYGLCTVYRAPSTRPLVRLTYAVKDDYRPITPESDEPSSAKATLRTLPIATLLLTKDSELLSAPTDAGEVTDQQASIKISATRLHWRGTKTQGDKATPKPDEKDDKSPRVRDGMRGGNAGISVKAGLRNKTGRYACV
ncbi:hypothetical protein AA0112_g9875 [Alternaria arborescens]|nr:hypothetical protein AA0112_g9875 [Alternaria arborescens]